jgi:type IV secretory pathway VirB6-like protein
MGIFVVILGFIFTAISLVIIVFAKIGIAVAMSLAPLAFVLLMMEQTRNYFEGWVKFLVGFFIIQILTSSLMGLMLYAAVRMFGELVEKLINWLETGNILAAPPFADDSVPFIILAVGSLVFITQIPTMASTLAGAAVAAAGTSLASTQRLMNGAQRMHRIAQRGRDAVGAANQARKASGGVSGMAYAAISSMRQSAGARQGRRDDRMTGRMKGENERIAAVRQKQYGSSSAPDGPGAAGTGGSRAPAAASPAGGANGAPSGNGSGNPQPSAAGANSPTSSNLGENSGNGNKSATITDIP